jgi:hypothetical protein
VGYAELCGAWFQAAFAESSFAEIGWATSDFVPHFVPHHGTAIRLLFAEKERRRTRDRERFIAVGAVEESALVVRAFAQGPPRRQVTLDRNLAFEQVSTSALTSEQLRLAPETCRCSYWRGGKLIVPHDSRSRGGPYSTPACSAACGLSPLASCSYCSASSAASCSASHGIIRKGHQRHKSRHPVAVSFAGRREPGRAVVSGTRGPGLVGERVGRKGQVDHLFVLRSRWSSSSSRRCSQICR